MERELADGLLEYRDYLAGELENRLRGYVFWLDEGRLPGREERLPNL